MTGPPPSMPDVRGRARPLVGILLAGLVLRLAILAATSGLEPRIVDEVHYDTLGTQIALGHGFAWEQGRPTSIRPPLYPAMLALVFKVAGPGSYQAVRLVQIVLSLATVVVAHRLARRLFDDRVALWAAAVVCFYPSLVAFNYLLLTEVLFTLLLLLFALAYVRLLHDPGVRWALAAGAVLGLGALARSILWPLPLLLVPLTFAVVGRGPGGRFALSSALLLAYVGVVAPWVARNTALQGTFTVIDTMGGLNLHMGNYEHTPLYRAWDAISLTGEQSWSHELVQQRVGTDPVWTEGRKEKWAQKRALAFMAGHPGLTVKRSTIKLANFWGLEREVLAGIRQGLFHPPRWASFALVVCFGLAFPIVAVLGFAGCWVTPPDDRRAHGLLLLLMAFISGLHAIVFGHSRYHLPLMPLLAMYAVAFVARGGFQRIREGSGRRACGAALTTLVLSAVWAWEILIVERERLGALLDVLR